MNNEILFSVVIPVYNEQDNIQQLNERLVAVLDRLCVDEGNSSNSYEIIFVDDGSSDHSWDMIKSLHENDPRTKGVSFSRNFGHHAAILAGLDHSKGEYVILMDGDLQDPPEEIPKIIQKMNEGFDIVQGVAPRRHRSVVQNIVSRIFNLFFVKISTVDPKTRIGLFRCLRRSVVDSIKKLHERSVFFGGLVSWVGFNTAYIDIKRNLRYAGRSKYSFIKRLNLSMNAIISFSERPLVFIFQLGLSVFIFSIFMFTYAVIKKIFYGVSIMGWTSLFAAIFFSTGLITLSLSIIGLYISKLFIEVKQRPRYILKEKTD